MIIAITAWVLAAVLSPSLAWIAGERVRDRAYLRAIVSAEAGSYEAARLQAPGTAERRASTAKTKAWVAERGRADVPEPDIHRQLAALRYRGIIDEEPTAEMYRAIADVPFTWRDLGAALESIGVKVRYPVALAPAFEGCAGIGDAKCGPRPWVRQPPWCAPLCVLPRE